MYVSPSDVPRPKRRISVRLYFSELHELLTMRILYISMLCERKSNQYEITSQSVEKGDDDGKWIECRLQEQGIGADYEVSYINIAQGDSLPDIKKEASTYDGIILGGTFHDVMCENLNPYGASWQRPLNEWLLKQRSTKQPLLGICGGHQAMAVCAGGTVVRRGDVKGLSVGTLPVTLTPMGQCHPLFRGISTLISNAPEARSSTISLPIDSVFHFGNGDEVSIVPTKAKVLATTHDSMAVALDYGEGNWYSTQFHPEASHTSFQHWVDRGVIPSPPSHASYKEVEAGRLLLANFLQYCKELATISV
jgi:GMP synthase-like glutamine amidotransferase